MNNIPERFPANDRKILRRLDEQAMRQVALGIIATLVSFVSIVWIGDLWKDRAQQVVLFGTLILCVSLLQGVLILGFETFYPRGPVRWRRRFALMLLMRAGVWSGFMLALGAMPEARGLFFLAMFLPLGLGAALAATWLADIWVVRLYLGISVLPPFIALLLEGSAYSILLAAMLMVFFYALVRMADGHFRTFWRALARGDAAAAAPEPPVTGTVQARLLARSANELRQSVSVVTDSLTLAHQGSGTPELIAQARRAALRLVDRLEAMESGAAFLRGNRIPELVAGSVRRRCEEFADDIGLVAAEAGVLLTTVYDPALPERLRTDYDLLFDGLRAVSGWALEQLPPGSELVLRVGMVAGQQEDLLQCAFDVGGLYIDDSLRNGIARCAHGDAILDPEVPLPLAIGCEAARLLGGCLRFSELPGSGPALGLEVRMDSTERAESDNLMRFQLKGRQVLLAGGTPALAGTIRDELALLDVTVATCPLHDLPFRLRDAESEFMAVFLDARELAELPALLAKVREMKVLRGARILLLSPGIEMPALPPEAKRLVTEWVRLPLGRRRLREVIKRTSGIEEAGTGTHHRQPESPPRPLRVLLVDDNAVNRLVAQGMLEKLGCEVESLDDGAPAVTRVGRGGIDLVLMDCEMPGLDGVMATRRIREEEAAGNRRHLPIVAMTAHAGESETAGFKAAGMDDVIVKPVSLATLATHIEYYRQRR